MFKKQKEKNFEKESLDISEEEMDTHQDEEDSLEEKVMAIDSRIGFFGAGIKQKEVLQSIMSQAKEHFGTQKGVYYKIVKFGEGLAYEIHYGCDKGVLKETLQKVVDKDLLLETNDGFYKVYLKSSGHLSMLKLRRDDKNIPSFEKLTPKDKLKPMESNGYGLFIFGCIVAGLGTLSLIASATMKHIVFEKQETITYSNVAKSMPMDYVSKIENRINRLNPSREYLLSVSFADGDDDSWSIKVGDNTKDKELSEASEPTTDKKSSQKYDIKNRQDEGMIPSDVFYDDMGNPISRSEYIKNQRRRSAPNKEVR